MKKLLVLALVLSIATVANAVMEPMHFTVDGTATTSATVSVGGTVMIGVTIGTTGNEAMYKGRLALLDVAPDGLGEWTGVSSIKPPTATIANASVTYEGYDSLYTEDLWLFVNTEAALHSELTGGLGFEFGYKALGTGEVSILLYDENYNVMETLVIEQIPEPATMLLLGLGGLLIRRKK